MKVLITTDLYTTATNGVVTSVKNLCQQLRELTAWKPDVIHSQCEFFSFAYAFAAMTPVWTV